jgi:acyl carrier protein|tara:strand:- start:277 stop:510 length:234 start_codon:yes stop_codon:yes gene_type:complete
MTIDEQVKQIISNQFKGKKVLENDRLVEDLGGDSLDSLEITVNLERVFKINELPVMESVRLQTVKDCIELVKEYDRN